ncbi:pyridoxamine 5'-phosphate oxidase family protein [Candidatus Saccharibacteria bacterium]|nr:pyridoxamine 5'-phosphate oxidase family protein [Candidatus Saccharibacteria bacterium]
MTNEEKILEYLAKQRVIALSTSDQDGVLHSAVVYVYGKAVKNWYVVSKQDTKKVRNLKAHPRFSAVAYDRHDNSTLQARGLVRVEEDQDIIGEAMAAMAKIYGTEKDYLPPIAKISAGEYVVLRLEVEWLRFAAYGGATPGSEKIFIEL